MVNEFLALRTPKSHCYIKDKSKESAALTHWWLACPKRRNYFPKRRPEETTVRCDIEIFGRCAKIIVGRGFEI